MFYNLLEQKTACLALKTTRLKSRKIEIFPKGLTHSFVQKMAIFPCLFLGNIGQENVFYNLLEQKNAFLAYKNNTFKTSKNWIFPKGLTHGFGEKMAIFSCLFLGNIGQENVFYNILEQKNAFLALKTTRSKSRKIEIFPKGFAHGFGQKMAIFPSFFSWAI